MSKPSTEDAAPNRNKLGPTGPSEKSADSKKSYDEKHPNAGNIGEQNPGPAATDDPNTAERIEKKIDEKRSQTPAD
jgi:hypothetical protein